ncbi:MAG: sugar phosphate isomerase/epimerase [Clostridia bacterium]|nr:sugar phosphate isomerase/epimerase [Clostridia bacterium]
MKLGFNEATCMNNSTLERDLELCEKYGYDYIEIRLDMLADYLKTHTLAELKSFFDGARIKPYAFNSIEDINFASPEKQHEVDELFLFACHAAQSIGNPYIIVVPTMREDMKDKSEKEVFEDSVKVLKRMAQIAAPYSVRLAFEPIGDPRWCVRSLRQCMEIINAVDLPEVGVALDAFNLYLYDELRDMGDIDAVPLEKLFVYHIDDCEDRPLRQLDHCHRLIPGEGIIPLDDISNKLKAKGYEQIASVELFRPEYWERDAESVIREAAEKTRRFL